MNPPHRYSDAVSLSLADGFLQGGPLPASSESARASVADAFPSVGIDGGLLSALQDHAMVRSSDLVADVRNASMDQWLAPRLHAALRIPRRLAVDRGFWAWLAIDHLAPYVHLRFRQPGADATAAWRFTGDLLRNGVSRLWWGAEMVRNGSSYEYVPRVFRRVRTAQFALELRYSHYRPAAIAFTRLVEPLPTSDADGFDDDRMKSTSKRINAKLATRSLEAIAGFHGVDDDPPAAWYLERPTIGDLTSDDLPSGPEVEDVPEEVLRDLEAWFRSLAPAQRAK